jgi:hypothetical protein
VSQAERRDLAVLSIVFAAGLFVAGPPVRDRRLETPPAPPRCINGVNGDCGATFWGKPEPNQPVRECPEGFEMGTVRPGVRYCVPERTIRQ